MFRNLWRIGENSENLARAVLGCGLRAGASSCAQKNVLIIKTNLIPKANKNAILQRSMCSEASPVKIPKIFNEEGQIIKPEQNMSYFTLFGLERTFDVDIGRLAKIYKQLQRQLHPDLFVNKSAEEQENSSEWSAIVNDGYKILQKPFSRALYLLELVGFPLEEDRSCVVVSPEFLAEIMEINEELADAGGSAEVKIISEKVKIKLEDYMLTLGVLFANEEFSVAREQVAHMKYYSNILDKIFEMETEFGMY